MRGKRHCEHFVTHWRNLVVRRFYDKRVRFCCVWHQRFFHQANFYVRSNYATIIQFETSYVSAQYVDISEVERFLLTSKHSVRPDLKKERINVKKQNTRLHIRICKACIVLKDQETIRTSLGQSKS